MENSKVLEIQTCKEAYFAFEKYEDFFEFDLRDDYMKASIVLDSSIFVTFGYNVLKELYSRNYSKETKVICDDKCFELDDKDFEKRYYNCCLTKEMLTEFPSPGLIKRLIEERKLQDLQDLRRIACEKFSGLLTFDQLDVIYYHLRTIRNGLEMKHMGERVIFNRYIDQNITITHCTNITFVNCVLVGNITIADSCNVTFISCIVKREMLLIGKLSNPVVSESIIGNLLVSNAEIDTMKLQESNILRLIIIYSNITNCVWQSLKIVFFSTESSSLPKGQIPLAQINVNNIRFKSYDRARFPNEKDFFISFPKYKPMKNKLVAKNAACLSTVDFLLQNAILGTDRNVISDLKYKKNFYSVKGIKKAYIFLTGSYYKPSRFIVYILLFNLFMVFCFTLPYNRFVLKDHIIGSLSLEQSIRYCLDLLFNINMFEYTATGISHILSIVYKLFNAAFVAGFFASMVKKFVE